MLKEEMKLKPVEYFILSFIRDNPITSINDISFHLNVSDRTVQDKLKLLEKLNVISRKFVAAKPTQITINEPSEWIIQ